MDLLANYDDDTTDDHSLNASPKQMPSKSNAPASVLENEWLSFEQMIAPGGLSSSTEPVDKSSYLVDGVVAYPGMKTSSSDMSNIAPVVQSSESSSSDNESGITTKSTAPSAPNQAGSDDDDDDNDDDAFFKMRKQVKERARSSSSDRSSDSSGSSSRSGSPPGKGSPSPPHLSPVNSVKSHGSEPPTLLHTQQVEEQAEKPEKTKEAERKKVENAPAASEPKSHSADHKRSKERKRSHRERSRSKHRDHGSSRSKKHRSRSRDRKHHSSRHRHKDKKRRSSRDRKRSKSRDRKRSRSRDRKNSRSEEVEKRRSRSRDRKDRKKDRKRSRSRHRSRSRSKDRRQDRNKDRRRKDRSRSKHRSSRSRSRERLRSRSPVLGRKLTFKEQLRKDLLTASKEITQDHKGEADIPVKRSGDHLKPSDLLKGIKISAGESVTPQMALMQTMAAMHKKAQELTGVEVPKYYNPAAVNPLKYAEQVQKRKLLWSKKEDNKQKEKDEQIETQWKSAFMSDEDSKTASKFRKLMGMKNSEGGVETVKEDLSKLSEEQRRKQSELFERLDQEYQFARMTTHTQRGVGLGFSSQVYDPNHPSNPPPT